jgi:hypothetical protein
MTTKHTAAFRAAQPDAPAGGLAALAHAVVTTPDSAITDAMRAEAAATAAKVDGSPVATNGKQDAELREWKIVSHDRFHRVVNRANDQWFDLLYIDDAARLYQVLNAFASLHAYVKAEELRERWLSSAGEAGESWETAKQTFLRHITSLGWDEKLNIGYFLATYRASALAKAGGQ